MQFDPLAYTNKVNQAVAFIKSEFKSNFVPQICLTLGSGGLGELGKLIEPITKPIPYSEIPNFPQTTVTDHEGKLILGYLHKIPVLALKGRQHFYEAGGQPNLVTALKTLVFPVYVARALGCQIYFATNAAGGLNPDFKSGDLMVINSHLDLLFPNALLGPVIDLQNAQRFYPQHLQYAKKFQQLLLQAAENMQEKGNLQNGVYVAVTGPTYETKADSLMLKTLGADAVGMSTIPEVITATSLGMETIGLSLITNVVAQDGTNATSNQEVMTALQNPSTKARVKNVLGEFFRLLNEDQ